MKIVFVGPVYPYRGGIAHFTTALAAAASSAGHEIEVLSFKRQYPKFLYPGKSDQDPSIDALSVPAKFLLDPLYPWTWEQARREIIRSKPDLVVFQWWTTFWAPTFGILARGLTRAGIKSIFLIHNVLPHETRPWDQLLVKYALSATDSFITLSETQRQIVNKLFPRAKVECTPIPVYQLSADTKVDPAEAKLRLGIPPERKVALFFGIVRPYKGLRLLVEAAGMLKRQGNPVHLLIAGEFWEDAEEYRKLIRAEGIEGWVTIDNRYVPNEEVPFFFCAADVFVAPYVGGTQSAAVKLAMGFGMPVVVTPGIADEMLNFGEKQNVFVSSSADSASLIRPIKLALQVQPKKDREYSSDESWLDLIKTLVNMSL
ncbi:MAG: glycosyltransferase [Bellilinea sp.]